MRFIISRRIQRLTAIGVAAVALFCGDEGAVSDIAQGAEPPPRPHSKVTVSKETTYITEPVTKDGYVDYLAALNAIACKGVTPQNNAAVLLYRALGPKVIAQEKSEQLAKVLGIAPLPNTGKYFEGVSPFVRRVSTEIPHASPDDEQRAVEIAEARFEKANQRPWSGEKFSLVADWLAENEKPLELIVTASKRPRFFYPLFRSDDSTITAAPLSVARSVADATRALITRAMLRSNTGRVDEAWQDILACHRLARLAGQGPTIYDALWGYAIDRMACRADAALADCGELSEEQARRFADELKRLPPMAKISQKLAAGERFMHLDFVTTRARLGRAEFVRSRHPGSEPEGPGTSLGGLAADAIFDWNESMRTVNAWYDRFVDAYARPTRAERDAALKRIDQDFKKAQDPGFLDALLLLSSRRGIGRGGGTFISARLLSAIIPDAAKDEDRAVAYFSMGELAFALAAYRADHGEYPTQLAQLCPKYCDAVPDDPFSNGPLRYKRTQLGYVVYSVGPNRKDPSGVDRRKSDDDHSFPADADDVVIVVPRPDKK